MSTEPLLDLHGLLAHDALLRRIAARMAVDRDGDDAVQDTWLALIRQGSLRAATAKAWLARVAGRFALRAAARHRRGAEVERSAARPECVPSALDLAERESVRRQVVEALLQLDPHYRDVLLLRFERDLPPRRIAAALGIPTETVRTRLKRGLALMRSRLDATLGPGRRRGAFLLLRPLPVGVAAVGLVRVALMTFAILGIGGAILAARTDRTPSPSGRGVVSPGEPVRSTPTQDEPPISVQPIGAAEVRVLEARDVDDVFPCSGPMDELGRHRSLVTRVVDAVTGVAIPGAALSVIEEPAERAHAPHVLRTAVSGADGWLRMSIADVPAGPLACMAQASGYATVVSSGSIAPFPVRMRRAGLVHLRVTDTLGRPVQDVRVDAVTGAMEVLTSVTAVTNSDGLAGLSGVDAEADSAIVRGAGFAPGVTRFAGAMGDDGIIQVVLRRPAAEAGERSPGTNDGASARVEFRSKSAGAPLTRGLTVLIACPDGAVVRTQVEDDATAVAWLPVGTYEIRNDDVAETPFAIAPDALSVEPGLRPRMVSLELFERPRVTVRCGNDAPDGAWASLVVGARERDVTEDVLHERPIPLPLDGEPLIALGCGSERVTHAVRGLRRPGECLDVAARWPAVPAHREAPMRAIVVVDSRGAPVADASVEFGTERGVVSRRTDAEGVASIAPTRVPPGTPMAIRDGEGLPLVLWTSSTPPDHACLPDGEIRVDVTDGEGRACGRGLAILDGEPFAITNGAARIRNVAEGEHTLIVTVAGHPARWLRFESTAGAQTRLAVGLSASPKGLREAVIDGPR